MFACQSFTSILAFLSFSVLAFPLSHRDVIAPQILEPDATSVWPIGTQQVVVWNTSGIPPASQITNPTAQIILGFNESNSLNLDFSNPLAQNFLITDGNVTVTVPDVTPRDDYIIVLFGDSGDTSPAFAITRISSPVSDTSSSSLSSGSSADSPTVPPTVPPTSLSVAGSLTTPALIGGTSVSGDSTTAPPPTGTTTSSSSSNDSSNGASAVTSALAASSSASSGWSLHRASSIWSSAAPLFMSVAPFIVVLMI